MQINLSLHTPHLITLQHGTIVLYTALGKCPYLLITKLIESQAILHNIKIMTFWSKCTIRNLHCQTLFPPHKKTGIWTESQQTGPTRDYSDLLWMNISTSILLWFNFIMVHFIFSFILYSLLLVFMCHHKILQSKSASPAKVLLPLCETTPKNISLDKSSDR